MDTTASLVIRTQNKYRSLATKVAYKKGEIICQIPTESLYDNFWHTFCDIQIEQSKSVLNAESKSSDEEKAETISVLVFALKEYLKMLHPFIPFITETIWKEMPKIKTDHKSLMYSSW